MRTCQIHIPQFQCLLQHGQLECRQNVRYRLFCRGLLREAQSYEPKRPGYKCKATGRFSRNIESPTAVIVVQQSHRTVQLCGDLSLLSQPGSFRKWFFLLALSTTVSTNTSSVPYGRCLEALTLTMMSYASNPLIQA